MHRVDRGDSGAICGHLSDPPPEAYACIPLVGQGEALGVFHLSESGSAQGAGSETRAKLAATVAEHLALTLAKLKLQETLLEQSVRDPLTGLFNRRYMEESLDRELTRAGRSNRPLGVILFDLDHFKRFNDAHGHDAGDAVLREVGVLVRDNVRTEDIACRYGGEEFILILLDTDVTTAMVRLQSVCRDIKGKRFELRGMPLPAVTVSVGLAQLPVHGTTPEELIRASDDALYVSKNTGRDRIEIFSGLRQESPTVASPS
jgi:diguanylate cyclase (GGDEF)-like protein